MDIIKDYNHDKAVKNFIAKKRAILQNTDLYNWSILSTLSVKRICELYEKFCKS